MLEDGFVPIFPDGFVALGLEELGYGGWGAGVVDGELLGGFLAGFYFFFFEFYAFAFYCEVEVIVSGAGVAAGFCLRACGHVGDA